MTETYSSNNIVLRRCSYLKLEVGILFFNTIALFKFHILQNMIIQLNFIFKIDNL